MVKAFRNHSLKQLYESDILRREAATGSRPHPESLCRVVPGTLGSTISGLAMNTTFAANGYGAPQAAGSSVGIHSDDPSKQTHRHISRVGIVPRNVWFFLGENKMYGAVAV